jgi:cyclic pyranopterin phosphate synthase
MMGDLSHVDRCGNAVMVDVSAKEISGRTATAGGCITMSREALGVVREGRAGKGDVLGTARLAGIMGAKRAAELIPLCHSLALDSCAVDFEIREDLPGIEATCTVKLSARTGAEMEALTGVSVALLTVYDMCKAMDRGMTLGNIRLLEKSGGKSGSFVRDKGQDKGRDRGFPPGGAPNG